MRIESKQKARSRRASPDRAEALMLAIGERRERWLWMDQDSAGTDHRQGRSAEEIADELEATVEEVNSWITKGAEREATRNRSRFEPECSGCHQIIEINTVTVSYMGRVYTNNAPERRCSVHTPPETFAIRAETHRGEGGARTTR